MAALQTLVAIGIAASGKSSARLIYGGDGGCPMSSLDEEFVTMVDGLAAFAAFCVAALLWLLG